MLTSMEGNRHASHLTNLSGPHAPTIHNIFSFDLSLRCRHTADHSVFLINGCDFYTFNNFSASGPCAFGKSLCNIHRVRLTILCQINAPFCVRHIQAWITRRDISCADLVNFHPEGTGHSYPAAQFFHPRICKGNCYRSVLAKPSGNTSFLLKAGIKLL